MSLPGDTTLYRYLAGALEPGEVASVEAALSRTPSLRSRLSTFARQIEEQPTPSSTWRIPPPNVQPTGGGMWALHVGGAVLGGEDVLRPGDRFRVHVSPPEDVDDRDVVVLRRVNSKWKVVFPLALEERLPAAELRRSGTDHLVIDLAAARDAGAQRWAVALPKRDVAVEWADETAARWDALVKAVADGSVPVASVQIDVQAA